MVGTMSGVQTVGYLVEEPVTRKKSTGSSYKDAVEPELLSEVKSENENRIKSGIGELDRVLGRYCAEVLFLWAETRE